jgi:hypothetical protein
MNEEDGNSSPEETLSGLKEMAMGNLERIADYANMIEVRMKERAWIERWVREAAASKLSAESSGRLDEEFNNNHDVMEASSGYNMKGRMHRLRPEIQMRG